MKKQEKKSQKKQYKGIQENKKVRKTENRNKGKTWKKLIE